MIVVCIDFDYIRAAALIRGGLIHSVFLLKAMLIGGRRLIS